MVEEARAIFCSYLVSKSRLTPFNNNAVMTLILWVSGLWCSPWFCPGYLSVWVVLTCSRVGIMLSPIDIMQMMFNSTFHISPQNVSHVCYLRSMKDWMADDCLRLSTFYLCFSWLCPEGTSSDFNPSVFFTPVFESWPTPKFFGS